MNLKHLYQCSCCIAVLLMCCFLFSLSSPIVIFAANSSSGGDEAILAQRQKDVADFLETKKGPLTKSDIVKLYDLAGHFEVIHGMLGPDNIISAARSREIGKLRQEIHNEVLEALTRKLKNENITARLGVNDFGSGSDPATVNAKTDIDFTLYPLSDKVGGDRLTAEYKNLFKKVTAQYGASIDPGKMDIVAHRYEAAIPDWRKARSLADFEIEIRRGTTLLKQNPDAYFLEGAYVQQVMGRSVKSGVQTFTWYEADAEGKVSSENINASEVRQYFYTPEVSGRYAWGGAVGNWHFFNSHSNDLAAQAKYLLRSVDDGIGQMLPSGDKLGDYANLPHRERKELIDKIYNKIPQEIRFQIKLALDTAANIRQLKANNTLDLSTTEGLQKAYAPILEYEKVVKYHGALPDLKPEALAKMAADRFNRVSKRILLENMIRSSSPRFRDWLAPKVKPELVRRDGKRIRIDPDKKERLQYDAFFELRDSLQLMDDSAIELIKRQNPKFRSEIEILEGIIEKQREAMLAPDGSDPDQALKKRKQAVQALKKLSHQLLVSSLFTMSASVGLALETVDNAWAKGQEWEDWLQQGMVDALLMKANRPDVAQMLQHLRESASATNERLVSPEWMNRIGKCNSLVTVLTEYIRQGEVNIEVAKVAFWEGVGYIPVLGMAIDIKSGGLTTVYNLALVQFVPGYAPVSLYIHTMKGLANLVGVIIFEPIKKDKVLMAYQGYLEPSEAGIFTSGWRKRQESPRPALLYFVDPGRKLNLEERRKRFYEFFNPRVVEATNQLMGHGPDIDNEEWVKKAGEILVKEVRKYVKHWWDGTGEWSQFDTLALERAVDVHYEKELRPQLEDLLVKDYMAGQRLAALETSKTKEKEFEELRDEMQSIAGQDLLLDQEFDRVRGELPDAGEIAYAMALDDMPEVKPGIEIIAAPRIVEREDNSGKKTYDIEKVNLRAIITASTKSHPYPWRVEWEVNPGSGTSQIVKQENEKFETTPIDRDNEITIIARAYNGNNEMITTEEILLKIEPEQLEEEKTEEEIDKNDLAGLDETLEALSQAARDAETLEEEALALCQTALQQAQTEKAQVQQPERDTTVENSVNQLESKAAMFPQQLQAVTQYLAEAEKEAIATNDTAHQLETLSLEICEKTQAIQNTQSMEEQQQLFAEIQAMKPDLRNLLTQAKEHKENAQKAAEAALQACDEIDALNTEITEFKAALDETGDPDTVSKPPGEVDTLIDAAQEKITALSQLNEQAENLLQKEIDRLSGLAEEGDAGKQIEEMKILAARVADAYQRVKDCPQESLQIMSSLEQQTTQPQQARDDIVARVEALLAEINPYQEQFAAVKKEAESAEATAQVADAYFQRAETIAIEGGLCVVAAEDLLKEPATIRVPNVDGMSAKQAMETMTAAGLNPLLVGGDPAPEEELSGTVQSLEPPEGNEVTPESTVTIVVYSDFPEQPSEKRIKVPPVIGQDVEEAAQIISAAGLTPSPVLGDPALQETWSNTVQSQSPAADTDVAPGTTVTLEYYAPFEVQQILVSADCSDFPGSEPQWDSETQEAYCVCRSGLTLNAGSTACIDCADHKAQFGEALANEKIAAAENYRKEAVNCSWYAESQQDIQTVREQITLRQQKEEEDRRKAEEARKKEEEARKAQQRKALGQLLTGMLTVIADQSGNEKEKQAKPPQPQQPQSNQSTADDNLQLLGDIVVTQPRVTIKVWDHECVDGDAITLLIEGTPVLSNCKLTNVPKSVTVNLPHEQNRLKLIAVDSGTDCPPKPKSQTYNSSAISISNATKGGRQEWRLREGQISEAVIIVARSDDKKKTSSDDKKKSTGEPCREEIVGEWHPDGTWEEHNPPSESFFYAGRKWVPCKPVKGETVYKYWISCEQRYRCRM